MARTCAAYARKPASNEILQCTTKGGKIIGRPKKIWMNQIKSRNGLACYLKKKTVSLQAVT
jgi:hypothetical protein